jgi:hypothetical protein
MIRGQAEVRKAGDEVAILRGHEVVGSIKGFGLHTYDSAQVLPAFGRRGRWPEIESTHDPLAPLESLSCRIGGLDRARAEPELGFGVQRGLRAFEHKQVV